MRMMKLLLPARGGKYPEEGMGGKFHLFSKFRMEMKIFPHRPPTASPAISPRKRGEEMFFYASCLAALIAALVISGCKLALIFPARFSG